MVLAVTLTPLVLAEPKLELKGSSTFSDDADEKGFALISLEGDLYVLGSESSSDPKALLANFSNPPLSLAEWSVTWYDENSKVYPGYELLDGTVGSDGVYAVGKAVSESGNQYAGLLAKYGLSLNASSTPTWTLLSSFEKAQKKEIFYAVATNDEGGETYAYVTGYTKTGGDNQTALLAKYNSLGALVWSKYLSGSSDDNRAAGTKVLVVGDGVYVAGYEGAAVGG